MELSSSDLIIYGAGGHAKVVASTALAAGLKVSCLIDARRELEGTTVLGIPVRHEDSVVLRSRPKAIIGIGNNATREKIASRLESRVTWLTLIHPRAWCCPSARLGAGTVVFAGAIVQPDVRIGSHVVINTAASVDHDCKISDFCQLAPGVALSGAVTLGERSFLGTNSAVRQGINISRDITVGVGAVVVKDLSEAGTYIGAPARLIAGT